MKRARFNPAFESVEDRLVPSTLTIVNDSTKTVFLELVTHVPSSSGQLSDGTSFGAPTPAYTEWSGSKRIAPGTVQNFNPGDSTPYVRLTHGGTSYMPLSGSGVHYYGARYVTLTKGYDLRRIDGASKLSVTLGNFSYGSVSPGSLQLFGITAINGFYTVPNDETITVRGPNKISGSETFAFEDHCENTETKSIHRTFSAPHGSTITNFTVHPSSTRGDAVCFYKSGNTLVENGFITGGGLFGGGGSYAGTVDVTYSYS
jgi:hypothetical protein